MASVDWYGLCRDGVMAKLRTLTSIFPNPAMVTLESGLLNTNKGGNVMAVFRAKPPKQASTRANGLQSDVSQIVIFDLYVRYKTDKESVPKFEDVCAEIEELLHPQALRNVRDVSRINLLPIGEPLQDIPGDNPNFVIQPYSIVISQRVTYSS